jgi:hypothetical protein
LGKKFVQMLTRRCRLAGIEVLEVWAGYSSTIGNLAFDALDAYASATEIARRASPDWPEIRTSCRLSRKGAFPVYGRMGRCPPNPALGRTFIGQSKRQRWLTAARTPTCRSALGVPMYMERK